MRILVSNDDGVMAPGIGVLAQQLKSIATVEVIAPDRNHSGASNSLTLRNPLRVRQLDNGYYSVEGTPSDCVHLGLRGLLDEPFDMVVSGINEGANLGDDVIYSGTVAAAMEGRFLGLPAIAVSMPGTTITHYHTGAVIAKQLVQKLVKQGLPTQTILNVNVPDIPLNEIKGIVVTRLGTRHPSLPAVQEVDPRGQRMYWVGPPGSESDSGIGTDFFAISQQCVSVTPLHIDMTHYKLFDQLALWMEDVRWEL